MEDPYISEVKYLGGASLDFIEIVVDGGTDVSDITVTVYNPNGTVRTVNALGTKIATIAGKDVYVLDTATSATFNGLHKNGGLSVDTDGTVHQFILFNDGPALTASGARQTQPSVIRSVKRVPVNHCKPQMVAAAMQRKPRQMTTLFHALCVAHGWPHTAGCLGKGLPTQNLHLSPQHRVLVSSAIVKRMFGASSALVAAKRLTALSGIYQMNDVTEVEYFHVIAENHEILLSEGVPTESFLIGPQTEHILSPDQLDELTALFPDLIKQHTTASLIPPTKQQKKLVQRHAKNNRSIIQI